MEDKIRVLLAEDHTIVREGLRSLLEATGRVEVVGEADNGRSAVEIARELLPDVAIVDVSMPELDGVEATRQIKKAAPQVRVIVLTMHSAEVYMKEVFRAGASGYLVKKTAARDLLMAVEAVMRDEMYLSPAISKVVIDRYVEVSGEAPSREGYNALSDREREVLKLVAEGRTNREVADRLNVAEKTVATHRANVMRKLELHNMSELVRYAVRERLIDVDESGPTSG
jgi:two-component system response regulator NreC